MSCETGAKLLDDYFDRLLTNAEQMRLLAHCRTCAECHAAVAAHSRYLARLQEFRLAAAKSPGLEVPRARNLPRAVPARQRTRTDASARPVTSWARLAAAVSVVGIGLAWYFQAFDTQVAPPQTADIGWSKVNIVINVPSDLNGARLTVSLPAGLHVEGYENVNVIAFDTDFVKGANALELPVRIDRSFRQSEPQFLSAKLEHGEQSKTFEFAVGVSQEAAPEQPPVQKKAELRNEGVHSVQRSALRKSV